MRSDPPPALRRHTVVWPDGRRERVHLRSIGKSGGAGEVFNVEGDPRWVAKIYHATLRPEQRTQYAHKIRWMVRNPPELPAIPEQHRGVVQLAWPVAEVLDGSAFAGFLMEKIDFERTMELDYLLTHRQAAQEGFEVDFGKLVTVCCNLAALIDCLHGRRIAVVDLKPINLKVYKTELYVSILDCDGFHIHAEGFVSEAPQVTPEYLAPEFHGKAVTHPQSQDRFALATIIFRLLNYGIHPYAGIAASRVHCPPELAGRIQAGLYPYGRQPHPSLRAAPASVHECFPDDLRELFDRAFTPQSAARTSAQDWVVQLGAYANRNAGGMTRCRNGHLQFAAKSCPACLRAGILQGHVERRKRFLTRLQASPARAVSYVRQTIRGTRPSPFQAALAQAQIATIALAPSKLSIRSAISVEIVWLTALAITYWWLK